MVIQKPQALASPLPLPMIFMATPVNYHQLPVPCNKTLTGLI